MKNVILLAAMIAAFATPALADTVNLIVDFKDDATAEQIKKTELDAGVFGQLQPGSPETYAQDKLTVGTFEREQADELIEKLSSESDVEVVEIEQVYSIPEDEETTMDTLVNTDALDKSPNDPFWKKQWAFPMIGLEKAWAFSHGEGVVVAVLDTGVSDGSNPDFPRVGDLKDAKFVPGYNFVNNNTDTHDKQSHGSHVSSTILENTHNEIGGAGIAYAAKLMPVKVLSDSGSGSTRGIAQGIRWATDHGANVINMSLGGGGFDQELANALQYAKKHNVFVACAAGNGGRDVVEYPAAMDGCHAVSAVAPSGDTTGAPGSDPSKAPLATYSSYGKGAGGNGAVFISAPGGDKRRGNSDDWAIYQSTVNPNNSKQWGMFPYNGTSMATPMVAGVTALTIGYSMAHNGGKYKLSDIESVLSSTAVDRKDPYKFGAGVISASAAMEKMAGKAPDESGHFVLFSLLGSGLALFLVRKFLKAQSK